MIRFLFCLLPMFNLLFCFFFQQLNSIAPVFHHPACVHMNGRVCKISNPMLRTMMYMYEHRLIDRYLYIYSVKPVQRCSTIVDHWPL